jgi:hypothetical protein
MFGTQTIPFTCQECGTKFSPEQGGACKQCRRVLCARHLKGWFGLWPIFNRDQLICVRCRRSAKQAGQ